VETPIPLSTTSQRGARLLEGPVGPTVLRLAAPMLLGIAALLLFNVVDTIYVGWLGARELAAMTFTFPLSFVVTSISMGLGQGASAVIAQAFGRNDRAAVRRLTTHALLLANAAVVVVALLGLWGMDPLFRLLGARAEDLPLVREYMVPWLLGVGLLVIPMVGNAAIRATGDTRSPSVVMAVAGLVNLGLDPLFIFGLGPFPRLGLAGAALATVISWGFTFAAALWILQRRERMLLWQWPRLTELLASWRAVLHVGIPAAGANLVVPLANGVLTRMVAGYGPEAVAAFGVGGRIESFGLIGVVALAVGLTPFAGQNFGAGRLARVRAGLRFAAGAAALWGIAVALALAALAEPLARVFSPDPAVRALTVTFLRSVPLSYGLYGIAMVMVAAFNALRRPLRSASLVALRLLVLALPLAWLGARTWGLPGIFVGMAAANLVVGGVALASAEAFSRRWLGGGLRRVPQPAAGAARAGAAAAGVPCYPTLPGTAEESQRR